MWRNIEKRKDKEHPKKISFFHIAGFWNGFCFVFEKTSSSLPMLFVHAGKHSTETLRSYRLHMFFKIGVPKNLSMFAMFLKACIFIKKEIPTQVLSCEYYEIFKNSFLIEQFLFIILFWNFMWWLNSLDIFGYKIKVFHISYVLLLNCSVGIGSPWLFRTYFHTNIFSKRNFRKHYNVGSSTILIESLKIRTYCRTLATSPSNLLWKNKNRSFLNIMLCY